MVYRGHSAIFREYAFWLECSRCQISRSSPISQSLRTMRAGRVRDSRRLGAKGLKPLEGLGFRV